MEPSSVQSEFILTIQKLKKRFSEEVICGENRAEKQGSQEKWHLGIVAVRFKDGGTKEAQIGRVFLPI